MSLDPGLRDVRGHFYSDFRVQKSIILLLLFINFVFPPQAERMSHHMDSIHKDFFTYVGPQTDGLHDMDASHSFGPTLHLGGSASEPNLHHYFNDAMARNSFGGSLEGHQYFRDSDFGLVHAGSLASESLDDMVLNTKVRVRDRKDTMSGRKY